jgi:pilus assembly protein CpaB
MKKVAIIPLAMGVLVGGLAIKFGLDTIQEAKANSRQQMVTTVVATVEIQATSEIDLTMVKLVETPMTPLLGKNSFTKLEDVVGRVASATIAEGGVVRDAVLAPVGTPAGLMVRIKQGFRAVSVKIDEVTGVAFQLRPGVFVDVIAVMDVRRGRRKETISRILLQAIEVAAVGRTLNDGDEGRGKGKVAKSVTLLVKDSDVPRLHLAQTKGRLTLAMRSPDDKLVADTGEATESEILGTLAKKIAEPAPKAPEPYRPPPTPKQTVTVVSGVNAPVELTFDGPDSMTRSKGRSSRRSEKKRSSSEPSRTQRKKSATSEEEEDGPSNRSAESPS